MKLVRICSGNQERSGILDDQGRIRDLRSVIDDETRDPISQADIRKLQALNIDDLPFAPSNAVIRPCISNCGKFICIGLNYRDHANEAGAQIPNEPIVFMKATSAIAGPYDDVRLPMGSKKTDWEVELGVVIGKSAKDINERDALEHIVGYCVINDLSEREFQLEHGGQWTKGKSSDGFGPIGPWLVTKDEILDVQKLRLWLDVNGHRYQNGNTSDMIFGITYIVSYLSRYMTLHPGDIISTGTPKGVGMGQVPAIYLKPGDVVTLGIDGLGEQRQRVLPHMLDLGCL
tara:strand:- start:180 stop:1043 length:864 start_codon:yes stop_codon:yes gene_type:complete